MTSPVSEVPEDIGRNEPCPCESGKKYKKCCFRVHQVQREASKQHSSAESLLKADMIPWAVFKVLRQVHENNMFTLFMDMVHEQSPFRARFPDTATLVEAIDAGEQQLVAGPGYDLRRIRLDGPDTVLLLTHGLDDPRTDTLRFDVVTLRPNQVDAEGNPREVEHEGPRIWDVQRHVKNKAELAAPDLSLSELGVEWRKAALCD